VEDEVLEKETPSIPKDCCKDSGKNDELLVSHRSEEIIEKKKHDEC
jgi:hypothetical protein